MEKHNTGIQIIYDPSSNSSHHMLKAHQNQLLIRSLVRGLPQRATLLLETMEQWALMEASDVEPAVDTYNGVLEIWAYSSEHNRRAMVTSIFYTCGGSDQC
jgi:hypothetical protein